MILLLVVLALITTTIIGCTNSEEESDLIRDIPQLIPPQIEVTQAWAFTTNDGLQIGENINCPDRSAFGYLDENIPINGAVIDDSTFDSFIFRWEYIAAEGNIFFVYCFELLTKTGNYRSRNLRA